MEALRQSLIYPQKYLLYSLKKLTQKAIDSDIRPSRRKVQNVGELNKSLHFERQLGTNAQRKELKDFFLCASSLNSEKTLQTLTFGGPP